MMECFILVIFIYLYLKKLFDFAAKSGGKNAEASEKQSSKPLKEKTTKAERRALQEAQRASKAAAKGSSYFFYGEEEPLTKYFKLFVILQILQFFFEMQIFCQYFYWTDLFC